MIRLALWVLGGLMLGGIIHIATVLGLPHYADKDAYTRIGTLAVDGRFTTLARVTPDVKPLPLLDPAMAHAVCRFSLANGPVRIRAEMPDVYWSIALFNRAGISSYSLSDRGVEQKAIDVLIANADQIAAIRDNPPDDFENIIVIDWATNDGFAMLRALAQSAGTEKVINDAFAKATCTTFQLPG